MRLDINFRGSPAAGRAQEEVMAAIEGNHDVSRATEYTVALLCEPNRNLENGPPPDARAIVRGAIDGAVEVGANLGAFAEGLMVGSLAGVPDGGDEPAETIKRTSILTIGAVATLGGDLRGATYGLMAGAVKASIQFGITALDAAAAAADGAMLGAEQAGPAALEVIRLCRNEYLTAHGSDSSTEALRFKAITGSPEKIYEKFKP